MSNDRKKGPTLDTCCAVFHRRFIPPPTRHPQPFKHFVRQVPGNLYKNPFHVRLPAHLKDIALYPQKVTFQLHQILFLSADLPFCDISFFVPLPFLYFSFLWLFLLVALPFWCDTFFLLLFLSVTLPFCYSCSSFLLLFWLYISYYSYMEPAIRDLYLHPQNLTDRYNPNHG